MFLSTLFENQHPEKQTAIVRTKENDNILFDSIGNYIKVKAQMNPVLSLWAG
jgi:hypothetical protein